MFLRYLKSSFVSIKNNLFNSFNAILSLSIGFLIFTLLFAFCSYYYDYDKQVDSYQDWYRLRNTFITDDFQTSNSAKFYQNLMPAIQAEIPEIEDYIIYNNFFKIKIRFTDKNENIIDIGGVHFVSKNLINHYNLKFIYGDPLNSEYDNMPIIVSRSFAKENFGREDVLGELIYINKTIPRFVVTGVYEDIPDNYHLKDSAFRFLNIDTDEEERFFQTHVRIKVSEKSKINEIQEKITIYLSQFEQETGNKIIAKLDPIHKIHFIQGLSGDQKTMNINIIHSILLVAILLLITAYLNFINLNSLIRQKRSNEFLFRKTLGATRYDIIKQLFTEYSVLYLTGSLVFLLLYSISKDIFNQWIKLNLDNYHIFNNINSLQVFFFIFVLGWILLLLPIIKFAKFNEISEEVRTKSKRTGNNIVLLVQLIISVVFIISALITYSQSRMIKKYDLGFDKENMIEYHIIASDLYGPQYPSLTRILAELSNIPEIERFTYSGNSVVSNESETNSWTSNTKGKLIIDKKEHNVDFGHFGFSSNFVKTLNIKVLYGSLDNIVPYNQDEPQPVNDIIINETFMNMFFPESNPVGNTFTFITIDGESVTYTIKAVLANTYFHPIHLKLKPTFYNISDNIAGYFQIYFKKGMADIGIEKTDKVLNEITNDSFFFPTRINIAQNINEYYEEDNLYLTIIMILAIISTIIALLGIYGISSIHVFSKLKDISIHKINGADIKNIFKIYGKIYLFLCALSFIVGSIFAWYIIDIFIHQYSIIISNLWIYFALSLVIISISVFIPVFLNIRKAYLSNVSTYINQE